MNEFSVTDTLIFVDLLGVTRTEYSVDEIAVKDNDASPVIVIEFSVKSEVASVETNVKSTKDALFVKPDDCELVMLTCGRASL